MTSIYADILSSENGKLANMIWTTIKKIGSGICSFTGALLSFLSIVLIYAVFWMTPRYDTYGDTGRFVVIAITIILCLIGAYVIVSESTEGLIDKYKKRREQKTDSAEILRKIRNKKEKNKWITRK